MRALRRMALAGGGGFLGRGRTRGSRAFGRRPTADPPALARRGVAFGMAAARAALLAAAALLVDGRPGAPFGLLFREAAAFVAFGDVVGLAFLLVGVLGLVAPGHAVPRSLVWCFRDAKTSVTPRSSPQPAGPAAASPGSWSSSTLAISRYLTRALVMSRKNVTRSFHGSLTLASPEMKATTVPTSVRPCITNQPPTNRIPTVPRW